MERIDGGKDGKTSGWVGTLFRYEKSCFPECIIMEHWEHWEHWDGTAVHWFNWDSAQ